MQQIFCHEGVREGNQLPLFAEGAAPFRGPITHGPNQIASNIPIATRSVEP